MWCLLSSKPANPDYHEFSSPLQLIWNSQRGLIVQVCVPVCVCVCDHVCWRKHLFAHFCAFPTLKEEFCACVHACMRAQCTVCFSCVPTSAIYAYKSVSGSHFLLSSFYLEIAASVSLCALTAAVNFNSEKKVVFFFIHCDYVLMCSALMPLERCECRRLRGMETVSVKY